MVKAFSSFVAQWNRQRSRRRTERALAELSPDLRRDIGFPAIDLFLGGKSRFLRG